MAAQKRGFAAMDENKQREIARKGAQAQPKEAKARGGRNSHGGTS